MRKMRALAFVSALVVLVLGYLTPASASVLGIDLSAEFIKVAAVKPGNPFHIVVDEQAKRKVPLAVAFDDGERYFGNNAVGFAIRKPLETYVWYHRLLGQTIDSPRVKALQDMFPYKFVTIPSRGGAVGIQKPNSSEIFTPEELVAMSLQHAMKIAKDEDLDTKDAVITVPGWFTPVERQAVLDAAEIAGMTVLGLINDNTASAITYGIDRQYKPKDSHTALFIDMGSAGLETSVVRFTAATAGKGRSKGKTHGHATVLSSAWDADLGGLSFDKTIRDHLVSVFTSKHGASVAGVERNPKAMAKLLKQAVSSKVVLSANKDVFVRLESVFKDEDLTTPLSRSEFYTLAHDLLARVKAPIYRALEQAGITAADLDAAVIVGGSVRIPGVQEEIKAALGRDRLDQNINGDEAMAMGAVFRAANVSTLFQARPFALTDISNFEVRAAIAPVITAGLLGAQEPRYVSLFKKGQPLGKRAKIRFYEEKDLLVNVGYSSVASAEDAGAADAYATLSPLSSYKITGVEAVAAELRAKAAANGTTTSETEELDDEKKKTQPRLALSFQLDQSGVVRLATAEAAVDELADVPNPAFKKFLDARVSNATRIFKRASFELDSAVRALDEAKSAFEKLQVRGKSEKSEDSDKEKEKEKEKSEDTDKPKTEGETEPEVEAETTSVGPATEEELQAAQAVITAAESRVETAKTALAVSKEAKEAAGVEETVMEPKTIRQTIARSFPLTVTRIFTDEHLNVAAGPSAFVGVDPVEMARSRTVLAALNLADATRKARAAAFNSVETSMYAIKNELYEDEFEAVTTEEQRESLRALAEATDDWIYGDGATATTENLLQKAAELDTALAPAKNRKLEAYLRPLAVVRARKTLEEITERFTTLASERTWMTEEDKKAIAEAVSKTTQWLEEAEKKQEQIQPFQDPVFSSEEVEQKIDEVKSVLAKVEKKRKPKETKDTKKTKKTKKTDKKDQKEETTEAEVDDNDVDTEGEKKQAETEAEASETPVDADGDVDAEGNAGTNADANTEAGTEPQSEKPKPVHDEL